MALAHSSLTAPRNAVRRTQYNLFIHSPIHGYLGYFGSFALANNAATNNYVKCLYGTWGKGLQGSRSQSLLHIRIALRPFKTLTARLPPAQLNRLHWGLRPRHLDFF